MLRYNQQDNSVLSTVEIEEITFCYRVASKLNRSNQLLLDKNMMKLYNLKDDTYTKKYFTQQIKILSASL